MSLVSMYEIDRSTELAKRFATLTAAYADDPVAAKERTSQIPMENLFRILEMYRYSAFDDEVRGGVLSIESFESYSPHNVVDTSNWHKPIVSALNGAMNSVFHLGETDSKLTAIDRLQEGLRKLSKGDVADPAVATVKSFFVNFQAQLA